MTDEIFEARRKKLQDDVKKATRALFDHMGGSAAFALPLDENPGGLWVAAGTRNNIVKMMG